MKIGILGLRPRQFADIAGRRFNGHEVFNYDAKSYNQESVASFCRKMDKVLIIRTGLPPSAIEYVTFTKRHVMTGSVSTIIRYLDTIPSETPTETLVKQAAVQPKKAVTNEELVKQATQVTLTPPQKLTSIVPQGYESQYTWSLEATTVKPSETGKHSYELLDAATPGDVLRLMVPANVDFTTWKTRIYSLRHYRQKQRDQLIEAHFYPKYVDLLVMKPKVVEEVKQEVAGTVEEQPAAEVTSGEGFQPVIDFLKQKVPHEAEPVAEPTPDQGIRQAADSLEEAVNAPISDKPAEEPVRVDYTPSERGFWRQVYLAAVAAGDTADSAANLADDSVVEYRKRFGEVRRKK